MVTRPRGKDKARPDQLGDDSGQVGPDSAGQSGDPQQLSGIEDASDESVEELADTDQAFEASAVDGIEDAANHPERPVHTHLDYGRPDDIPPNRLADDRDENDEDDAITADITEDDLLKKVDVEDLSDEDKVA